MPRPAWEASCAVRPSPTGVSELLDHYSSAAVQAPGTRVLIEQNLHLPCTTLVGR